MADIYISVLSKKLNVCLFVCLVIYFKVASIPAAYLRYTRLRHPNHPRLGNRLAYNQFTREVDQVFEDVLETWH